MSSLARQRSEAEAVALSFVPSTIVTRKADAIAGSGPAEAMAASSPPALLALARLLGRQAARRALHDCRGDAGPELVVVLIVMAALTAAALHYNAILSAVAGRF